MFHPEELDRITRLRLPSRFVTTIDSSEYAADARNISWYAIIIRYTKQFQLVAQYLDAGLSLRQVAQVMVNMK